MEWVKKWKNLLHLLQQKVKKITFAQEWSWTMPGNWPAIPVAAPYMHSYNVHVYMHSVTVAKSCPQLTTRAAISFHLNQSLNFLRQPRWTKYSTVTAICHWHFQELHDANIYLRIKTGYYLNERIYRTHFHWKTSM